MPIFTPLCSGIPVLRQDVFLSAPEGRRGEIWTNGTVHSVHVLSITKRRACGPSLLLALQTLNLILDVRHVTIPWLDLPIISLCNVHHRGKYFLGKKYLLGADDRVTGGPPGSCLLTIKMRYRHWSGTSHTTAQWRPSPVAMACFSSVVSHSKLPWWVCRHWTHIYKTLSILTGEHGWAI